MKHKTNPFKSIEYIDPEVQTPKLVIMKNIRLEAIVVTKTLLKLILFKNKYPINIITAKEKYCHKKPG